MYNFIRESKDTRQTFKIISRKKQKRTTPWFKQKETNRQTEVDKTQDKNMRLSKTNPTKNDFFI